MAQIEHLTGTDREAVIEEALKRFRAMEPGVLMAQDILLRGAIDVLQALIARGCSLEDGKAMLNDCLLTLGMVHGTALKRGVKLAQINGIENLAESLASSAVH